MDRRLYGIADVLELVPRSRTQLYRDMDAGLLPYLQVGRRRYFEPAGIDVYIENLKGETTSVDVLVALIDEDGRVDLERIPKGTSLADLEAARRMVAQRRKVPA